jgi:hypothetical protein
MVTLWLMKKGISQTYRSRQTAENCVYSTEKLISFSLYFVTVHQILTAAFRALIDRAYRNQVSGTEKSLIFQWETYRCLPLFRYGHWKPDSFVALNLYRACSTCYAERKLMAPSSLGNGPVMKASLLISLGGRKTRKKKNQVPPSSVGGAFINLNAASTPLVSSGRQCQPPSANEHELIGIRRVNRWEDDAALCCVLSIFPREILM